MNTFTEVTFKSISPFFEKERDGFKRNTVREIDENDERFKALRRKVVTHIYIINPETGAGFTRIITDYCEWKGLAIISW